MTDRIINGIFAAGGVAVGTVVTFFVRGRKIKKVEAEGQSLIDTAQSNYEEERMKVGALEDKYRSLYQEFDAATSAAKPTTEQPKSS